ncbi:CBS domain-containing protein [Paenisporosarcina quisquiliarum]|uniref:CBS domain-containing protein n=1 Tax=Paenisporosarcina quisquiliarum TaxID=365346 RepID=A0A9X3RBY6_9BACL|nr:CBS domain-containing protein [Paenisporosarcina quisquiliarum]MCZ8535756.1 CBS domain-containing protein [Paenisporosarcina quisquiliarum]
MFAKSVMIPKEKCISIQTSESVQTALDILEKNQIDALPVLENGLYKGILNRYIVYRAFYFSGLNKEDFLASTSLMDVVTREEIYLSIDDVFEDSLLQLNDFPIIAVVEENRFLGLVTRFDIMDQFRSAFGMDRPGVRITFTSVETEGRIARVGDIIQKFHESVISLVTFDESDKLLRRIVLKIEKRDNIQKFLKELDRSGFRVLHMEED